MSKGHAVVHSASVEDSADGPDSELVDDTTEHNNQDRNGHGESSHHADSNPCFDEISEDNPEDERGPTTQREQRTMRAT